MSELVLLHHNEPMTTSLAIAEGTENTHDAIMKMVRKYISALQEFGRVGFEIEPFDTAGGIQTREVAFLNEPQATLLITFLRNSEIVVRFKVALVKAFFELRDRLRVQTPQFTTRQLDHGADLAVAADRTFRSFMRAGRSAGLSLQKALRTANDQTIKRTGMDILAELNVDPDTPSPKAIPHANVLTGDPIYSALAAWVEAAGDGPWRMVEILGASLGIKQGCRNYEQTVLKAAMILKSFGFEAKKRRVNGSPLYNYWYRS